MSSIFGDGIDTTKIEAPQNSFEPLAPGKYDVIITKWESKPNRHNTGMYLQLTLEVTSAHGCGRLLWVFLNLKNQNPVAEEIAKRELKQIGDAIGITNFVEGVEDQLVGKSLSVKVAVDGDRNKVKGYYKLGTQSPAAQQAPAQPAAAATEQSNIPW